MYAVSRLRAMENRFLDMSFFSRLIENATLEDAFKSLGETVYAQWIAASSEAGFDRVDRVIDSELKATYEDLARFVPDKELIGIFRMPYDFNNVKVILKSLFKVMDNGERRYDLLSNLGGANPESLVMSIEGEKYDSLPYGLGNVIPRCLALWDRTKNSQQVENLLDGQMFASMLVLAEELRKKLKTDVIVRWVRHKIDAENLRSAVRLQRMNYDYASGLPFFHKGGTISPESAAKLLSEPFDTWSKPLFHYGIGAALEPAQDKQEKADVQAVLSEISKRLDDYLIRVLDKAKYKPSAPENVIVYLLRKEEEARNLRVALVCVANGLNREFARRLLSRGR